MRHIGRLALATLAGLACTAAPAAALTTCGSLNQPVCVEAPPPGAELTLTAAQNPYGLGPIATPPSSSELLWPRVKGHEPFGMHAVSAGTDGTTVDEEAMLSREIGASMARMPADWAMIQYYPNAAAGGAPWNYAGILDGRYRSFVARGIRPLLAIMRTPRRFTSRAGTYRNSSVMGCGTSDACQNPPTAAHLGDLARFAADLAKRYPLAAGIEVWNEPNLSNPFWGGEDPNPEQYAAMLATVHDAVKAVRPAMRVLGGALAPFEASYTDPSGYPRMAMRSFLARMLRAGAAPKMDALSYHPYLGAYSQWTTVADQEKAMMRRFIDQDNLVLAGYADAGQPLLDRVVATEIGASTTEGYTPEQQAYWLHLRYNAWDTDHWIMPLPVDAMFLHKAVDETNPPFGQTQKSGFGLVRVKDSRGRFPTKPAFCKFRLEVAGFTSCPGFLRL